MPCKRYFPVEQDLMTGFAGNRYLPSVTSITAKIIIPSASHSVLDRLSPPKLVPSRTATTGLT